MTPRSAPRRLFARPDPQPEASMTDKLAVDVYHHRQTPESFDAIVAHSKLKAGQGVLVLAVQVGDAKSVPTGQELENCRLCGAAVWIDPELIDGANRHQLVLQPACSRCIERA